MNKQIAWFSPHITHYNNFLFDSIANGLPIKLDLFYYHKRILKYPWKEQAKPQSHVFFLKKLFGIDWLLIFLFLVGKRRRYDAIVVAGWAEPTMIVLLSVWKLTRTRIIIWTDTPKVYRKRNLKQFLRSLWLRWILGTSVCLVTGESGMITLKRWGAREDKIFNFPFVTDLEYFSPSDDFPLPFSKTIRIFSSARLDLNHKGYHIALKALSLVKKRYPQVDFQYTIAGSGPDEDKLIRMIDALGLEENITLLGWVETDKLLSLYRSNDILLHPAINDPFPNAVLEAMACGLIVIGSDTSGSVIERITHQKNGFIHRTNDEQDVVRSLEYLIECDAQAIIQLKRRSFQESQRWDPAYNLSILQQIL